jgi:hypothetical protein
MSELRYQIEGGQTVTFSVNTELEVVLIETDDKYIECDFSTWKKLVTAINRDIEAHLESKPRDLFFGYQIVKKN